MDCIKRPMGGFFDELTDKKKSESPKKAPLKYFQRGFFIGLSSMELESGGGIILRCLPG
jgi:hypothetical protein